MLLFVFDVVQRAYLPIISVVMSIYRVLVILLRKARNQRFAVALGTLQSSGLSTSQSKQTDVASL